MIVICDKCYKEAEVTQLADREWHIKCHGEEQLFHVTYGEGTPEGKQVWSNLKFVDDATMSYMATNHIDNLVKWGKEARLYEHLLRCHDPNRGPLGRVFERKIDLEELIDTLIWLRDG